MATRCSNCCVFILRISIEYAVSAILVPRFPTCPLTPLIVTTFLALPPYTVTLLTTYGPFFIYPPTLSPTVASPDILMMAHSARWLSSCSCQTAVMCSHQRLRHDLRGITCSPRSPHGFLTFIMPLLFDPDCFSRSQTVSCLLPASSCTTRVCASLASPHVPSRLHALHFTSRTSDVRTFSVRGVRVLLLFNHISPFTPLIRPPTQPPSPALPSPRFPTYTTTVASLAILLLFKV